MYYQQQQAMLQQQYAMAMQAQQAQQPTMYMQPQHSYTIIPGATMYVAGTFPIPRLFVSGMHSFLVYVRVFASVCARVFVCV